MDELQGGILEVPQIVCKVFKSFYVGQEILQNVMFEVKMLGGDLVREEVEYEALHFFRV